MYDDVQCVNVSHDIKHHVHRCDVDEQKDELLKNKSTDTGTGSQFFIVIYNIVNVSNVSKSSELS